MRRVATITALATAMAFGPLMVVQAQPSQPGEASPWVHVRIDDSDDDDESMAINLPLAVVELMLRIAPTTEIMAQGRAHMRELPDGLTLADIRELWRQLAAAGDAELVSMRHGDATVRVARRGDQIQVRMTDDDGDESMTVDVPARVVDALLSGDGDELNIEAAIMQLRTIRGDLVRMRGDDDHQIRVWIDESAS